MFAMALETPGTIGTTAARASGERHVRDDGISGCGGVGADAEKTARRRARRSQQQPDAADSRAG